MEALHSRLTPGEPSGGQEHRQPIESHRGGPPRPESPSQPRRRPGPPRAHGAAQHAKQSRRPHPERKRLRHQRQSVDPDAASEHKREAPTTARATSSGSGPSPGDPAAAAVAAGGAAQCKPETQEGTVKQKRERKPQRPGKYVCSYCGRACAKPSVLQKHIRSHTGERPYPCAPCGFSFKTKSNLYKHRKSHTHRVKAGLALGEPRSAEEQATESEDETRALPAAAASHTDTQSGVASIKSGETDTAKDCDSYAVKKRLALRLSRGKHGSRDSSDGKASSSTLGSRGSTESGYFSRSESTEQPPDGPPNTSAKSYAEIILGKYGRLGHLQRTPLHRRQRPAGEEDQSAAFTVPKEQVIDHITKLITTNEAVVDTSKIDSVKPRRFSLSRKNSSESPRSSSVREQLVHSPKAGDLGFRSSGSITMGVPCEKFHHPSPTAERSAGQTSAPLARSHSVPTAASSFDASGRGPCKKFPPSRSFDERTPPERQASRRYGMLRRQPAVEIPPGAELTKEEREGSPSFHADSEAATPDHEPIASPLYECEACGNGCEDWEGYKRHKQSLCSAQQTRNEMLINQMERSQLINPSVRAGASAMRKRRKEDSLEFDEPPSPSLPSSAFVTGRCKDDGGVVHEGCRRPALQTCSVIQHTSSFEKQESLSGENPGAEAAKTSPPRDDYPPPPQTQHRQQSAELESRKLVRQLNVPVPEILLTADANASQGTPTEPTRKAKPPEKPDEFQWPQRSPSLSQLPIEKLPPKKKRLRLAEAAQSSGESSFDSASLPRSPGQDSAASRASSRSTSFEESSRADAEMAALTPLRRSRASVAPTVPGLHQHREMRRSASEQAPHDQQPGVLATETRSKSFDYSCLSPERSAAGWRDRRRCLLMRHTALRDPDEEEEEEEPRASPSRGPEGVGVGAPQASATPARPSTDEIFPRWNLSQNIRMAGEGDARLSPPRAPQPSPAHGPSGAARARYLPMSTGLKLEIPSLNEDYPEARGSRPHVGDPVPRITSSQELLTPVTSPAVAVRLQTDTLTLGCAIYTTPSRVASPTPEERLDAVPPSAGVPAAGGGERRNPSPDLRARPDDDLRISGPGGSKRTLSPSNSIEIHPESQQQQKRVKEEDEREAGCDDETPVVTGNQEVRGENRSCIPSVCSPDEPAGSPFPSLLCGTSNSWCYLNYAKPSPTPVDQREPSVYSAWSTGGRDPNPPGLSSKAALSLLHCKQRLSPAIYTTSAMTDGATEPAPPEDRRRPCAAEVCSGRSRRRRDDDGEGGGEGRRSADDDDDDGSNREEEARSCSGNEPPAETSVADRRSDERRGGGGGRGRCDGCGVQVKGGGVRQKGTGGIAEDQGSRGAELWGGHLEATGQGACKESHADRGEDHQGRSGHDDDEDDDAEVKEGRGDEDVRSKESESSNTASCDGEKSPPLEPEPGRSTQKSSASLRRAQFARWRPDASASPSPAGPRSPGAPSSLSPLSRRDASVSASALRPASPLRGLSPVTVLSPAGTSAGGHACLHPGDRPSIARLSADEVGPGAAGHRPPRPRGADTLLSHLPLHSQQPGRAPSHWIAIGGIHMIQPRFLPLYSLVSAAAPGPAGAASRRPGDAPKGRSPLPPRLRDALKETPPGPPDPGASGGSGGGVGVQPAPRTETTRPEADAESRVHPESTLGQKEAPPSSQTQL